MHLRFVAYLIVILAFLSDSLNAQTFHGAIRGSVRDATGAVPSAAVELIEQQTQLVRSTTTNDAGEYAFANLLPGTYDLRVAVSGYKTYGRLGLRVATQTFLTVDVRLEVGNVVETVVVNAPAGVERTDASISTLVDSRTLSSWPSAGRNVFYMTSATPTVIATGDAQFVRQQDQSNSSLISIAGGPRRANSYVLDGVPIVDIVNRASFIPNLEALEEVRVQLSAYDAEIGRTSGGVFNTFARSGSNAWRGSALYENRPGRGMADLFFARKNQIERPDGYFHLFAGSLGGPIERNRSFFWVSTEGYRTATTRSTVLVLPTELERRGDFSQSGMTIYDPLTTRRDPSDPTRFIRDAFPNNRIPETRLNPVARAMLQYLPLPTNGKSRPAVADIVDRADQLTAKLTRKWTDRLTSTGLYAWYESMEPDARFFGGSLFENGADPGDGALVRRVQLIAINNTWTPSHNTAVALRYGYNQFLDDNRPGSFDPSSLAFAPGFLASVPLRKFPSISLSDYGRGGAFLGDRDRQTGTYYSHNFSAAVSAMTGRQVLRVGGEYRVTGVDFVNLGGTGGYSFTRDFTLGPNPNAPATATGDAFASFLLGYPASGSISVGAPIDIYLNYWAGFVQDDIRVTPKLSVNLGLRYEFEDGLRERENRFAVGWAFDRPFPIQVGGTRPDGRPLALTGGLVYAGVDGAPTHQGHPNARQFAPRVGAAYAIDDRTVLRGGYGLFWSPAQGIGASEIQSGTRGYNITTSYVATLDNPFIPCSTCSLTNPFPRGFAQPVGNAMGTVTGVGEGYVDFVDPSNRMGHLHRYSIDLQRELPHDTIVGVAYIGATGANLGVGGSSGSFLDINQLDARYQSLGTALQEAVPNPFFGTPLGVGILAGDTIPRGQLLRPYPQFNAVYMTRSSLARSRYNAIVVRADRRLRNRWGTSANYTWSRAVDSQFGESNFFAGGSSVLDNHNVDAEYRLSVLDTPHRVNVSGTVELPFGFSVTALGTYQSGFPFSILQTPNNSNLLGSNQRPNIVPGVNPQLTDDPADSYDPACSCIRWLNPAAWSQAAPFTFGNAPRTDGRVRTPPRRRWDVAIQKRQRVKQTSLLLRAEIINVFDTPDFRGPGVAFGDASFGQIREAAGFPRMLQLLARVAW